MSFVRFTLLFFAVLFVSTQAVSFDFVAGTNVSYQGVALLAANLQAAGHGFRIGVPTTNSFGTSIFQSLAVDVAQGSVDAEIDAAATINGLPVTLNAYFNAAGYVLPAIGSTSFDASAAANFIATWPYAIVEVDASGADVYVQYLQSLTWSYVTSNSVSLIAATQFQATFTHNAQTTTLTFTAQTSAEVGVSTFLNQALLPKSWSLMFGISNYAYATASNSLRLRYASATGDADVSAAGSLTVTPATPNIQAYLDLAATATLDGTNAAVSVSAFAQVSGFDLASFLPSVNTQVNAKYGGSAHVYMANVTFGANAQSIVYTPQSGSGTRLSQVSRSSAPTPSSASAISLSFALIMLVSCLALTF